MGGMTQAVIVAIALESTRALLSGGHRKTFIHLLGHAFCMWNVFSVSQHLPLLHIPWPVSVQKRHLLYLFSPSDWMLAKFPNWGATFFSFTMKVHSIQWSFNSWSFILSRWAIKKKHHNHMNRLNLGKRKKCCLMLLINSN